MAKFHETRFHRFISFYQYMKQIIRCLRHAIYKATHRDPVYLYRLPVELILDISSLLDTSSMACLALTCKRFFNMLPTKDIFNHPDLSIPPIPYIQPSPPDCYQVGIPIQRRRFLQCLQRDSNRRLESCFSCLILHPLYPNPFSIICLCNAGIVDLCPCVRLSSRQKSRLIEWMENVSSTDDEDIKSPAIPAKVTWKVQRDNSESQNISLYHTCSAADYDQSQVDIGVTLSLKTTTQELVANIFYDTLRPIGLPLLICF
jgi:hypothetical protein